MRLVYIIKAIASTISICGLLSSCAFIEMSGTMTRKTGEIMSDYANKNDGFIGKMAGFGGRINEAVGSTVEKVATRGKEGKLGETKQEQFVEANRMVMSSAYDAARNKVQNEPDTTNNKALNNLDITNNKVPEPETIIQAQIRLLEFGYDIGEADGVYGNKTKIAIEKYQQTKGLTVTGNFDDETLVSLGVAR